jgi:transcriptional regulator with XRE-family HTH domain
VTVKDSERAQVTRVTRRFAKNLVALRRQSGLSQERVASRSGLHRTEISLLERGLRVPRLNTIVRLAGGVDREPCDLFAGMAWRIDRGRLHAEVRAGDAAPGADAPEPPGSFEIKVGSRWETAR